MPVSEDEYDKPVQMAQSQTTMSKAEQRKSNKPIMEKRRRARINHCLNELKTLILDAMKKDPARHSKLEKADILEMTVKHLQQIQRQQLATAVAADPGVIMRFKSGFDECAAEVSRYIGRLEGVDSGVKQRLTAHLHRCVSGLQQISAFPHSQTLFSALAQNCDKTGLGLPTVVSSGPEDVNNNSNGGQTGSRIQIPAGLHLIPSRLPTGELALLVPNSNHMSTFLTGPQDATFQFPGNATVTMNSVISSGLCGSNSTNSSSSSINPSSTHASAFTAVTKVQDYPSPTSTADIVKKEPACLSDKDDYGKSGYSTNRLPESLYHHQHYNFQVTESKTDSGTETQEYRNSKLVPMGHDSTDPSQNYGKFNSYLRKSDEDAVVGDAPDLKTNRKPISSSFQRTIADSTTSFVPAAPTGKNDDDVTESGFKPFQVEIPNSHLKAHISISRNFDEVKKPSQVQHKPNPNFTINPNRMYQRSPNRYARNYADVVKVEPSASLPGPEPGPDSHPGSMPVIDPSASCSPVTGQSLCESTTVEARTCRPAGKRPLSPDMTSSSSSSSSPEPPSKAPRISLNVTLTEQDRVQDESGRPGNRCKRISVIVEDSSKSNGQRDGSREVAVSVSSQKDMWRPW